MNPPLFTPNDLDPDPDPDESPELRRGDLVRMPTRPGAVVTGPATSGLGSMFGDPLDVARYYTSKYRGESEQKALRKGDPGIGSPYLGEIDTTKALGVAVPHDVLTRTFGSNPAAWRTARAQVNFRDKTFNVPIVDIGPGKEPRGRGVVTDLSAPLWQALGLDPAQGLANVQIQLLGNAGPDYTSARADWDQEQTQIAQALQVPQFQAGGIVTEPTVAMVGEAGPEAIVPLGNVAAQEQDEEPGGEPELGVPFSGGAQEYAKMMELLKRLDPGRIWRDPRTSPMSQYPRLWSPETGYQAPLAISPLGETGTQMFWRKALTEHEMPLEPTDPRAEGRRQKQQEEEQYRLYHIAPGTGDQPPRAPPTLEIPGTGDVPEKAPRPVIPIQGAFPATRGMMQTSAPAQAQEAEQPLDIESLRAWLSTAEI